MSTINLREVTAELNLRGIPATYEMSGGGCGTIYAGRQDSDGFYECAIGPSSFATGEALLEEVCYSKDGEEREIYYVTEEISAQGLAEEIESMFFTFACGSCGGIYVTKEADEERNHQREKCESNR